MKRDQLDRIIATIEKGWCQHAEARDKIGEPVCYDDKRAVAYDVRAAIEMELGYEVMFKHARGIYEHLTGKVSPNILDRFGKHLAGQEKAKCYCAIADWNDSPETDMALVIGKLTEWRAELQAAIDQTAASRKRFTA